MFSLPDTLAPPTPDSDCRAAWARSATEFAVFTTFSRTELRDCEKLRIARLFRVPPMSSAIANIMRVRFDQCSKNKLYAFYTVPSPLLMTTSGTNYERTALIIFPNRPRCTARAQSGNSICRQKGKHMYLSISIYSKFCP